MEHYDVVSAAWSRIEPELLSLGYELVEVEYTGPGHRATFRLYIDKPGGVTLDDCAAVTQFLNPFLDAAELVPGQYILEVSSPGIDRPLRKPADFERFRGEPVKVRTKTAVHGRRRFTGVLTAFRDGLLTLDCSGQMYTVHLENVQKANLDR